SISPGCQSIASASWFSVFRHVRGVLRWTTIRQLRLSVDFSVVSEHAVNLLQTKSHQKLSQGHSRSNMAQQAQPERAEGISREMEQKNTSLPILPVRDTVLFPHAVLPLTVGRESSVQLINSLGEDKTIVVVAQREAR